MIQYGQEFTMFFLWKVFIIFTQIHSKDTTKIVCSAFIDVAAKGYYPDDGSRVNYLVLALLCSPHKQPDAEE